MAIRAGQIVHAANNFVIDRVQTGGPGNLNIPQEKIHELGNYQSVATVFDIPDLSFGLDCLDVDTEIEAILTGSVNPTADPSGKVYDLSLAKALDVISPWKSPYGSFAIVRSVAIPQLTLESVSYRYGVRDNAGEQYTLRGDSIFYVPGTAYQDVHIGDGTVAAYPFAHTAIIYNSQGRDVYALNVSVNGNRMVLDEDYTETSAGITLLTPPPVGARVSVVYGSTVAGVVPQSVHQGLSVKPAAIKGKDIDVYFSTLVNGNPVEVRWPDVQSFNCDWKITLEDDYEFGNARSVAREATDVPDVTGSVEIKPRSVEALFTRLSQITGVPANQIIGPDSAVAGALRCELRNPVSGGSSAVAAGTPLKTLYVPAARFTVPGYEGRVQQKYTTTVNYTSDDGVLEVIKGAM